MLTGSSPVEIDYGRGFRAEQWSRFCGRFSCAEMIEKCARVRLLEKTTSCKWSHDAQTFETNKLSRTKTNPVSSVAPAGQTPSPTANDAGEI